MHEQTVWLCAIRFQPFFYTPTQEEMTPIIYRTRLKYKIWHFSDRDDKEKEIRRYGACSPAIVSPGTGLLRGCWKVYEKGALEGEKKKKTR